MAERAGVAAAGEGLPPALERQERAGVLEAPDAVRRIGADQRVPPRFMLGAPRDLVRRPVPSAVIGREDLVLQVHDRPVLAIALGVVRGGRHEGMTDQHDDHGIEALLAAIFEVLLCLRRRELSDEIPARIALKQERIAFGVDQVALVRLDPQRESAPYLDVGRGSRGPAWPGAFELEAAARMQHRRSLAARSRLRA